MKLTINLFLFTTVLVSSMVSPFVSAQSECITWYENTTHGPGFRNVKSYGAKGDGITDDTQAFMNALTQGRSSTFTTKDPTLVYVPAGTYIIKQQLPLWFYTHLHGNFKCPPTLVLPPNTFTGSRTFVIATGGYDGDHDDEFYRGLSYINIKIGANNPGATALFWSVSQATFLRNVTIDMTEGGDTGMFMENGSGGFISDLTILGGNTGLMIGNQQWFWRSIRIDGSKNACINLIWDWVFTFTDLHLSNCPLGIQFTGNSDGALLLLDSTSNNVNTLVSTAYPQEPVTRLFFERLVATNTAEITTNLPGNSQGTVSIASWRQGPYYIQDVLQANDQSTLPLSRPDVPLPIRSRPTFGTNNGTTGVTNVYSCGAKGDGVTDDTKAIQTCITNNAQVFLPQGWYLISQPLQLRSDSVLVGEVYSVLIADSSSSAWTDASNPQPLLSAPASSGTDGVQIADILFTMNGDVPGCILLDWQSGTNSGLWDVEWRIMNTAHTLFHIHGPNSAIYAEQFWSWVADHDIDSGQQLNISNPYGVLIETQLPSYFYGTAAEHSLYYQYNVSNANNVTFLITQTETPYFQVPPSAWAMTIENSANIQLYGSGYYNWFNGNQTQVFSVNTTTNMNAFGINVHGVETVLVGDQGTIPAYTPVEEDWFCDGFAAYTGL